MAADKRISNVTENKTATRQALNGRESKQDMQVKELSDTTVNPSNLGNVSSIRDPKYSQDMLNQKKQP